MVLPNYRSSLGVMCKGIGFIVVRRVGLLTAPLRLVLSLVPVFFPSLVGYWGWVDWGCFADHRPILEEHEE